MNNVLAKKLAGFATLSDEDERLLAQLSPTPWQVRAGHNLIDEGDRPDNVFLLLEGWAHRYKLLPDGRRQIVGFLIPGDLCDIHIFILKRMDHSIGLLSEAKVAAIPKAQMLELIDSSPTLNRALWWATLVDEAILREWLVSAGQRNAYQRVAHLFCEMRVRMQQVGLAGDGPFSVPLTQEELADTMGLTPIHVNRTLKRLRAEGLITMRSKQLEILDPARLIEIAGFDPSYLHLTHVKRAG